MARRALAGFLVVLTAAAFVQYYSPLPALLAVGSTTKLVEADSTRSQQQQAARYEVTGEAVDVALRPRASTAAPPAAATAAREGKTHHLSCAAYAPPAFPTWCPSHFCAF